MLIEKRRQCPYRATAHENLAYAVYTNGAWCYSCNKGTFKDRPFNFLYQLKPKVCLDIKLSENATRNVADFPIYILAWLYNYYIYDYSILQSLIMYIPYEEFNTKNGIIYSGESLIFPLLTRNTIIGFQRRFFPSKQFYSYGLQYCIAEFGSFNHPTVVLVEDYLSAIRVGQLENCIWLQGTSLTKKLISYIMQTFTTVKFWLDGDEPGQQAAKKGIKQLQHFAEKEAISKAFAIRESKIIKNIVTEKDPKCYSPNEMREILYTC